MGIIEEIPQDGQQKISDANAKVLGSEKGSSLLLTLGRIWFINSHVPSTQSTQSNQSTQNRISRSLAPCHEPW